MPMGSHSLELGKEAPSVTLSSGSKLSDDSNVKGKYVVINFWSYTDPESRLNNKRLADYTSTLPSSKIKLVSICTDSDTSLINEIMKADGISSELTSLSAKDVTPDVIEDYQIKTGNRSFLIDPFGNLVSVSPSHAEIAGIIS